MRNVARMRMPCAEHIDCLEHKGDMSSFWSFGLLSLYGAQKFSVIFCCFSGERARTLW